MSVINQMLQDLDKRRVQPSGAVAAASEVRVLPPSRSPRVRTVKLAAIVIAVAALAAALTWGALHLKGSAPTALSVRDILASPLTASSGLASNPSTTSTGAPPVEVPAAVATPVPAPASPIAIDRVIARAPSQPAPEREVKVRPPRATTPAPAPESAPEPAPAPIAAVASRVESAPPANTPARRSATAPQAALGEAHIDKRAPELTPQQRAENEYRAGANLLSQDRSVEAQEKFKTALTHSPEHTGARQALFALLVNAQQPGEAERVLSEGLMLNARQPGFAMALARMQLDRADVTAAVETLQRAESVAVNNATYLAFLAALLQRQDRHPEAIERYRNALALAPNTGVWMMGLGISLQALNRTAEAQDAFRRAKASNALNPELLAFVDERLVQLQRR